MILLLLLVIPILHNVSLLSKALGAESDHSGIMCHYGRFLLQTIYTFYDKNDIITQNVIVSVDLYTLSSSIIDI